MKKILNHLKNYNYLYLTGLLGLIVIITVYILQDVAPFGRNSMLTVDFFHQYGPMLAEFFDRIHSGESLLYSFNTGLGLPFFRNFFNYLSSPLNILIFLFKRKDLIMSYSIIIGIRSIISAITMSYYLRKKFDTKTPILIGLGLLYAYSAYFTAYYWNIMWLDGLIFLPLIILGIENIINKNNGILYTISLTVMLYSNYFIGYMICIFSCIYFLAYLIIKTKKIKLKKLLKTIGLFTICSLIAGAFNAWALIPMFEALTSTNATMGSIPTSQYYAFTIPEFFKNHLTGVTSTVFASDISNSPNVSCGILSIALFLLFWLNKKVSLKRKIVYTSILAFLLLSFYIAPIDYIWHAFHVPNDLPYRYSFLYSFILIIISAYTLKDIKDISFLKVLIVYILSISFITFVYLTKFDNITDNMIKINYLLITTYFLIYTLYHFYPKFKKISCTLFLGVIALECIVSINHNWDILQYIDEFYADYNDINTSIKLTDKKDNELFYRTEKNEILTLNDGAWYDYYGQTTFSSMAYNNIAELQNDLGQPGNNINSYYYKQNTPIYDLIFDIKYTIGSNKDNKRYSLTSNENNTETYKFNYTTGLMFGVNSTIKHWNNNYINPLEYQNDFIENTTNIENVLYRLTLKNKKIVFENNTEKIIKFTYKNEFDNIYIYADNTLINYIVINDTAYYNSEIDINEIQLKTNTDIYNFHTYDEPYVINETSNNENIEIYISYKNYLYEEPDIYTINNNKFLSAYNLFKEKEIEITSFKEHKISGKINLKENTTIYTSIPYDKGWKVYSNGKEINTYQINNSLLGFDLNKGKNNITLKYTANNIDIGIAISITTAILTTTYLIIKRKKTIHQ